MELVLNLDNGITVTATPIIGQNGDDTVGLALRAETPVGPQSFTAQTTKTAIKAMIAAGKAKFGPKITAFLNRVRGLYNMPPMPRVVGGTAVDATAPGAPLAGLTGAAEGSVSAGLWAYGPYATIVPVRYRVRRPWRTLPWWWPNAWAWPGYLQPGPWAPWTPQWQWPWYLRTDAAGPHPPLLQGGPPPGGGSGSIGRGFGGARGYGNPYTWGR